MTDSSWERLAEFGALYEADLIVQRLEAEGIPVFVRGPEVGIFGPGFSGASPLGVMVFVPKDRLERARDLLNADVEDVEGLD
mgnify:CR=1 FL=1